MGDGMPPARWAVEPMDQICEMKPVRSKAGDAPV